MPKTPIRAYDAGMSPRIFRIIFAGLLAAATLSGCSYLVGLPDAEPAAAAPASYSAEMIRVIDGDTIVVKPTAELPATNEAGTEHTVRLLGIDTPEMNYTSGTPECGAQAATSNLYALLIKDQHVTITFDKWSDHTDRFGRSLAYVGFEGSNSTFTDAALSQTALGYAEAWYPKSEPTPERFIAYNEAAVNAQNQGIGSWASCSTLGR